MDIDIVSLFPNYFTGPFDESMIKRARGKGILNIRHVDLREFGLTKHKRVDDTLFGGGPGMLLKPEPLTAAIRSVNRADSRVIYLSPQGKKLDAKKCEELAKESHLIFVAGHYEGIDERVMDEIDEEISIGDYVLTNGALAAIVVIDALARFVPGVLGDEESAKRDSFQEGTLDAPHYTSPVVFEGKEVPEVLRSGNHKKIEEWRKTEALKKTKKNRPDLYLSYKKEGV